MSYIVVGLGNPGEEYTNTRHNTGRIVLNHIFGSDGWKMSSPHQSLLLKTKIGKTPVLCLQPETFMNKSGIALKSIEWNAKKASQLIVIHDELDMGIGTFKISFNRSAGGHRGVESIVKAIKTEGFIRIRIGISPVTPSGKVKKPVGEAVEKTILGEFKPVEQKNLKNLSKKVEEALTMLVEGNLYEAMSRFNAR